MFDESQSNQSSPYFSGSKRRRDSLFAPSHPSLQPYLMGTSGARSPTQKRTRLSLGGSGNNSQDLEWSSLLNFQTSLRPARNRGSNLRRRETIHSLPGQPSPFSNSNSSIRSGVMNQSPGFFVRNRNERQSVARALQILDSRKRLRELSSSKPQDKASDAQEQASSSSIDEINMKRRRLTINGTLDEILHQEQTFASTSLGEIANKSSSRGLSGMQSSSYVQKRIFTSSVLSPSEVLSEPSSKRQRPGANASTSENLTRVDFKKTEEKEAERSVGQTRSQSDAAQRRRLLSYITPSQVEARYARQSAATELARSRSTSRSTTPSVTRLPSQVTNPLTTTGAQTELSCNQKETLQKSPDKEEETGNEDANKSSSEQKKPGRRCQLSVKEFVAHLDRARSSTQTNQSNEVLKRSAVDNEARRERLNRLRKLLSDVTKEPVSAPTSAPTENGILPSMTSTSLSVSGALTKTSGALPKFQSFGFGQSVTSTAPSMVGPSTSLPSSVTGGIAFGLPQKTSVTNVSAKPTTTSTFGQSSTPSSIIGIGQPSIPAVASIPSLSTSLGNTIASIAKPTTTPSSVIVSSQSLAPVKQTTVNTTSASSDIGFNFGQSVNAPSSSASAQAKGISFGQLPSSTSQSSSPFAFGQPTSNNEASSLTVGNSSVTPKISADATNNSKTSVNNVTITSSVLSFGQQPTSATFSFGETEQPTVNSVTGPLSSVISFEQTASTANSTGANSTPKTFSFGSASSNNGVAAVRTSSSLSKPVTSTANSFAFGNTVQSTSSSAVSGSAAASVFPQIGEGKGNAGTFTFGTTSNTTKPDANPANSSTGPILGQQTSKASIKSATDASGGLFSFNKSSESSKVSTGSSSSLFGFGSSSALNGKAANNSQGGGGFSFTPNQQINKSEPKPNGPSSGGLFSFGETKGNAVTNTGSLFGNGVKKSSLVPSSSAPNASAAPFSFGSNTASETGNKAPSTAVTQPYSFGSLNGSTTSSSTSSFVFDSNAKSSFVFGKSSSGPSESSGAQVRTGSFSFGSNQVEKPKQSVGDTPVSKTNGTAGFTFHPPAPNQTGAFSFGGSPAVSSNLQSNNSTPSPFAFGAQQPVPPQAPAANMFSQTNPTSAPRKKGTGLLRKRSTRK